MPSIRVDDSVWKWLKSHARPLEDTPNSVLRRLAGLDPTPAEEESDVKPVEVRENMETVKHRFTGEQLRKEYSLPVHHCLYHKDGKFFERLTNFPGALCDPQGYLQYDTEAEFKNDPRLNIGKKVNVSGGISTHPKYRIFPRAKGSEMSDLSLKRKAQ